MLLWWSFFLGTLEREETSVDEKEKTLEALFQVMAQTGAEFNLRDDTDLMPDSHLCERILTFCIKWIASNEKSRSANHWIGRLLRYTVYHHPPNSNVISRMIDNDLIFPFIFDGISSEDKKEHEIFFDLLDSFARCSEKKDRDTIVIRYFNRLRNAISFIFTRDVIFYETIEDFCLHIEITSAMLALMPSLLFRWAMKKLVVNRKYSYVSDIILRVLETSLESPLTLQNLLGTGILKISNNFSLRDCDPYHEEADVFRRILEKHPEFRQQFREWTAGGVDGNMVAELGRTIPPKDLKRGTEYVFFEEDWAI